MTLSSTRPELLAPAGDWDAMRAAAANGADAVYFGLGDFNARHRATNFSLDELPRVMDYLRGRNVRGYVAFNTLVFSDELPKAAEFIAAIARAGVDAVIVQDLGLTRLIRRLSPGLPIHGSTQMTLTEPRGVAFVRDLGVARVILARELSAAEVGRIAADSPLPVEVFVHGALCVSYSGQCLTSESLGGRSANRGQCAQACRLPYELVVDGEARDLGDRAYLLSPQDLAAYDLVADLTERGVCSFKIEGRLKSAAYVAATTQAYRAALDAAIEARPFRLARRDELDLQQTFSRGFSHGFLGGVNHQTLVPARFSKSRGVPLGTVVGRTGDGVRVELAEGVEVRPGDGVVFESRSDGDGTPEEQGGRVTAVRVLSRESSARGPRLELAFRRGDVDPARVAAGAAAWKTDDPALRARLEASYARDGVARRVGVAARMEARVGRPLVLTLRDESGREATAASEAVLERASKHPLTLEALRAQLDRFGDTPFELREVELHADAGPAPSSEAMVPRSVLNDLRRRAADLLMRQRSDPRRGETCPDALGALRAAAREVGMSTDAESAPPALHVLVRRMDQLDAALAWLTDRPGGPPRGATVYADFEDIRGYKDTVARARAAGVPLAPATTRVLKPGEEGLLRQIAGCEPDAVLVRNLAGLEFFRATAPELPLIADYALNIANELTAALLAERGVRRMVPSYDLSWLQLAAMVARFGPARFETVVHQHMPMFHMEHCVFAATLSSGKDYRDCGRPCERHRVELRDRVGQEHPLVADVGCRNTVFNAQAQSAAEYVPRMLALGLRHYRVELLRENAEEARLVLDHYARLLEGQETPREARRSLRVLSQLGVTAGTLER